MKMCVDCKIGLPEVTCPSCYKTYCYRDWMERRKAFSNGEFNDWIKGCEWCFRCGR